MVHHMPHSSLRGGTSCASFQAGAKVCNLVEERHMCSHVASPGHQTKTSAYGSEEPL